MLPIKYLFKKRKCIGYEMDLTLIVLAETLPYVSPNGCTIFKLRRLTVDKAIFEKIKRKKYIVVQFIF